MHGRETGRRRAKANPLQRLSEQSNFQNRYNLKAKHWQKGMDENTGQNKISLPGKSRPRGEHLFPNLSWGGANQCSRELGNSGSPGKKKGENPRKKLDPGEEWGTFCLRECPIVWSTKTTSSTERNLETLCHTSRWLQKEFKTAFFNQRPQRRQHTSSTRNK